MPRKAAQYRAREIDTHVTVLNKYSVNVNHIPILLGMYRISGSGWPDIRPFFSNPVPAPVPAKTASSTGYLSRIVFGPLWQLVELSSPSEWAPYCKHVHLNFKELVSHVDQLFYIY